MRKIVYGSVPPRLTGGCPAMCSAVVFIGIMLVIGLGPAASAESLTPLATGQCMWEPCAADIRCIASGGNKYEILQDRINACNNADCGFEINPVSYKLRHVVSNLQRAKSGCPRDYNCFTISGCTQEEDLTLSLRPGGNRLEVQPVGAQPPSWLWNSSIYTLLDWLSRVFMVGMTTL